MVLLDSKNSAPLYHPLPPSSGHKNFYPIEVLKDIQDERRTYFKWQVLEVTSSKVEICKAMVLQNRMMHMLTGEEKYLKENKMVGNKLLTEIKSKKKRKRLGFDNHKNPRNATKTMDIRSQAKPGDNEEMKE